MPDKTELQEIIRWMVVGSDDIAFTSSVFVQCFLPTRALRAGEDFYQVSHGNASLAIEAGRLVDPDNFDRWEKREVPAGAKARLLFAYINDQAIRTRSPSIDMGTSLRNFMERNGIPIGGRNAREIVRQAKNIAAANIMLGVWGEGVVQQDKMGVAKSLSFWLEKDTGQSTLWQPQMVLSNDYMETLESHRMPLDFRALVALQANPRAMDVYCWLAYRMCSMKTITKIPYQALHPVFGRGIKELKHFKTELRRAVLEAQRFYPDAKLSMDGTDYLTLYPSPPAIPTSPGLLSSGGLFPRHG